MVSLYTPFPRASLSCLSIPRRGTPNVSTETVIEARSSFPSAADLVVRSDFCPATPQATVGRAGVIKVGEQNRTQTKEREREAEKKSCMLKSAPGSVSLATPRLCSSLCAC